MTRDWIVIGDITSSGGRVISGSPFTDIDGKPVSREDDMATCPRHKGVFPIKSGCDATMIVDGKPVALHGAKLWCGCTVLSAQQHHVFSEYGGARAGMACDAKERTIKVAPGELAPKDATKFDDSFRVELEDGKPAAGYRYELKRSDGSSIEGLTDAGGMIPLQRSDRREDLEIRVFGPEAFQGNAHV